MKKLLMMVVAAIAATMTFAETYTWTGGTGSFTDPSKWTSSGGGVPGANADIVFTSDATVTDVPGLTLSTMALGGNVTLVQNSGTQLVVSGIISGNGRLEVDGTGTSSVWLKGANTFKGGYYCKRGRVYVDNDQAFGTGAVDIRGDASGWGYPLYIMTSVATIANDISICREASSKQGSINVNSTVQLTGKVKLTNTGVDGVTYGANYRIATDSASAHLIFSGGVEHTGSGDWVYLFLNPNCNVTLDSSLTGTKPLCAYFYGAGVTLDIKSSQNAIKELYFHDSLSGNVTTRISADNPFASPITIRSKAYTTGVKKLDLNGHDVSLSAFDVANSNFEIASVLNPATLTCTQTPAKYPGKVSGLVTIAYNKVGGTLSLTGDLSGMTGGIWAKAGTVSLTVATPAMSSVKVDSGAAVSASETAVLSALSDLEVANGASLSVASGVGIAKKLEKLVLGASATLDIADGAHLVVNEYWTVDSDGNATRQEGDKTYKVGNVTIEALGYEKPSVYATWTDAAPDDARMENPQNWSAPVDLSGKNLVATFASAGETAVASGAVDLKGIVFDSSSDFTISGTGPVSLYESGLLANGACSYCVTVPIAVMRSQDWEIGQDSTVTLTGGLQGICDVFAAGMGHLIFESNECDYEGTLTLSNASTTVKGCGLGTSPNHRLVFSAPGNKLCFENALVKGRLDILEKSDAAYSGHQAIWGAQHTTNRFDGPIYLHYNNNRIMSPKGCEMIYAGGLNLCDDMVGNWLGFVMLGEGRHVVTDTPMNVKYWISDTSANIHIAVGGNKIGEMLLGGSLSAGAPAVQLHIEADNAFDGSGYMEIKNGTRVCLHGHDLLLSRIATSQSVGSAGRVSSDSQSVLCEAAATTRDLYVTFEGGASYRLQSSAADRKTTLHGESSTTGTVEVVSGGLKLAEDASWVNASAAKVSGGTMTLMHGGAFSKKTDVFIASGATMALDFDGVQTVRDLYVNGSASPLAIGDYGAADNPNVPAGNRLSSLTGRGILHVRGAHPGLILVVQ